MNLFGWTIGKAESRATNYTDALSQALQGILDEKPTRADALAVVESCVSLISDPLLVASTIGGGCLYLRECCIRLAGTC